MYLLLLFRFKIKAENRYKTGRLVNTKGQCSFNENHLNFLRVENSRSNIEHGDKKTGNLGQKTRISLKYDDKIVGDLTQEIRVDTR